MWLLSAAVRHVIESAYQDKAVSSAEQQAAYAARIEAANVDTSRVLRTAGDVAQIDIAGVITKAPSFLASLFGGGNVTYPEIISALAEAEADPAVSRIELAIDSPGGHVDGLFEAVAALQATSKPIRAVVRNRAASAAYALASQAGEIVAVNRAAEFGSVGVVQTHIVFDDEIDITSTNAPKKRPDPRTEEGQAVIREELDALHTLFVEAIATGRKTTPDAVNEQFGQGAVVLADEALALGMIDSIAGQESAVFKSASKSANNDRKGGSMDLNELKTSHPEVYAAAVEIGVAQERDRVNAHLISGEACGDMKTAIQAIADGELMTATMTAKYHAASMNRTDIQARADDEQAVDVAGGAPQDDSQDDIAEAVVSFVEARKGITKGDSARG